MESFVNIHESCKRALPSKLIEFKHAVLLHKLYNEHLAVTDWIELNMNQILTFRQTHFKTSKTNTFKVGNYILTSRLNIPNGKILLKDLNLSIDSFKVKYKKILL